MIASNAPVKKKLFQSVNDNHIPTYLHHAPTLSSHLAIYLIVIRGVRLTCGYWQYHLSSARCPLYPRVATNFSICALYSFIIDLS